jgi:hypothetical protein
VELVLGEMVGVTEADGGTGLTAALEFNVRRVGGGGPRCGARAVISNRGTCGTGVVRVTTEGGMGEGSASSAVTELNSDEARDTPVVCCFVASTATAAIETGTETVEVVTLASVGVLHIVVDGVNLSWSVIGESSEELREGWLRCASAAAEMLIGCGRTVGECTSGMGSI